MKTILIIEDNRDIRENTVEILQLKGYNVFSASNGKTGLDLAKEILPHVILCDIMMPEMNGYEVLQGLKNNNNTQHIPFVFLTASVERKDVENGLGMGAQGYIRKPFETEELFEIISGLLKEV